MIEEFAVVKSILNDREIIVETNRSSTCGSCQISKGCGSSILGRLFLARSPQICALNSLPVKVGDQVVIGVEESVLVRSSIFMYLVPLLGLMLGAVVGEQLSQLFFSGNLNEGLSVLGGIAGLVLCFYWLSHHNQRLREHSRFQPRVLSVDSRSSMPLTGQASAE